MAANSTEVRQHLLTRSDLAAMAVADDRVDAWLASGELALVDMVEEESGSTAVYAATTDSLRDQLQLLLEQNGRSGVMLGKDEVLTAMQQASDEATAASSEDVIAEHSAEEQLDQAIDAITDVIDDLVESSDKFPVDLKSEEAVALADEVVVEESVPTAEEQPTAEAAPVREPVSEPAAPKAAEPVATATAPSQAAKPAAPVAEPAAPVAANPVPAPAPAPAPVVQPIVQIDLQPVIEALQQVHLAVLALGERPQPQFDSSPITAALDHGIRALQQDIANAADRTVLREGIENLRTAIASSGQSVVEAVRESAAQAASAANGAATSGVTAEPARGFDLAAAIATVAIATGWGIAIWTFAGDARLALGSVVCANLVGCCALLLRRR